MGIRYCFKEQCALRRLEKEMGIITKLKKEAVFKYRAKYDINYGEHEAPYFETYFNKST
jgi:isopentenyldiphosphate isomerase